LTTKSAPVRRAWLAAEMKRSMLAAVANSNVDQPYKDYIANNADLKTADDATLDSDARHSESTGVQRRFEGAAFRNMRDCGRLEPIALTAAEAQARALYRRVYRRDPSF
jgi:hypothetical protein